MGEKRNFFSKEAVAQAQKTLSEKGLERTSDRAIIVLATNHFDDEIVRIRKFLWGGLIGVWSIAGVVIIALLFR